MIIVLLSIHAIKSNNEDFNISMSSNIGKLRHLSDDTFIKP